MRKKFTAILACDISYRDFDGKVVKIKEDTEIVVVRVPSEMSTSSTGETSEVSEERWYGLFRKCQFDLAPYEFNLLQ